MKKAKILSVGRYMPERVVTSEEVEEMAHFSKFGVKSGLTKMLTGCETRHFAAEGEYCSDIAAKAGLDALKRAGVEPSEIDALLFCSVTHDFAEPATANVVADKMGVRNAFVFDIKNACNAFLSGVDVADSLIKTGKAETVLVVSGEAFSRWMKFDYDNKAELMERAPVALSLGDGGGAFLLRASDDQERGINKSYFHTYSDLWNHNVVWGGGVMYPHASDKLYVPGIRAALEGEAESVTGTLIQGDQKRELRLDMKNLPREERDVILCVIKQSQIVELKHLIRALDDEAFARQWVEARAHKRLGPQRIARELGCDPTEVCLHGPGSEVLRCDSRGGSGEVSGRA